MKMIVLPNLANYDDSELIHPIFTLYEHMGHASEPVTSDSFSKALHRLASDIVTTKFYHITISARIIDM